MQEMTHRHMFNKETIGKMKKGSFLVNNARGAICDPPAVVEALKSGQLRGVFKRRHSLPGASQYALQQGFPAQVISLCHLAAPVTLDLLHSNLPSNSHSLICPLIVLMLPAEASCKQSA